MFDYVSDLHLDNALWSTGPLGWVGRAPLDPLKSSDNDIIVVAGDTAEHIDDTIDVLNRLRDNYDFVFGIRGNHDKGKATKELRRSVYLLDELYGHSVLFGDTIFVGACLEPNSMLLKDVVDTVKDAWDADHVEHVVLISHYPPEQLMGSLGCPNKETTIIFGHTHIETDQMESGYRLLSNPRGYRGKRRDNTAFVGFKPYEALEDRLLEYRL
jgi:predicted phosphodiesterase